MNWVMASSNPMASAVNNNTSTETVTEETTEGNEETLRLKLKKGAEKKKIQWTEDTIDNEGEPQFTNLVWLAFCEGLGKKKSKCCCQYKKPRANLDESSEDESDDGCGDCPGH